MSRFVSLTPSAIVLATVLGLSACQTLPQHSESVSTMSSTTPESHVVWHTSGPSVIPTSPLQLLDSDPSASTEVAVTAIEAPNDLWDRMRRGFDMPDLDNNLVRQKENWYSSRPDYIDRMVMRGSRYLFHIVEEIERREMPMELALLPIVESAFNPQAVSHARAAGMWQFMPATGRDFDLTQNAFRDDRRDVLASTRAALDYLQRLHNMFGDWHLALAAYNWGSGNVQRAIRNNRQAGRPTGYTDLRMPRETREYVPKLQAVKNIVFNPSRFGLNLPKVDNYPYFDVVDIDRDMDIALIASLANIEEAHFRQLNPSHNKPVIMAAVTNKVLLPKDNVRLFMERIKTYQDKTASWTVWRVPQNMSVVNAAKLHGITETSLREVNRIPPRMTLRAGSTIVVPRGGQLDRDVPSVLADHGQIWFVSDVENTRRTRVERGVTLNTLANQYGVTSSREALRNQR